MNYSTFLTCLGRLRSAISRRKTIVVPTSAGLIKSNTKWALFLAASKEPEDRHIMDLAFGLQCLEAAGIDPSNIFLYIDGTSRTNIERWIANGTQRQYQINNSTEFFTELAANTHDNLILFVTGHGSQEGIDSATPIKPYALLRAIKSAPKLKQAIIYLGQCHAGIFNYIGAGRKTDHEPNVILIGATNLNESISADTTEKFNAGDRSWSANLFLLYVFKWISTPRDVDGDGIFTAIDSYKYAGALANKSNKDLKVNSFARLIMLHESWQTATKTHTANPTPQSDLARRAAENLYVSQLSVHHVHQECWILNAIPAQTLSF